MIVVHEASKFKIKSLLKAFCQFLTAGTRSANLIFKSPSPWQLHQLCLTCQQSITCLPLPEYDWLIGCVVDVDGRLEVGASWPVPLLKDVLAVGTSPNIICAMWSDNKTWSRYCSFTLPVKYRHTLLWIIWPKTLQKATSFGTEWMK